MSLGTLPFGSATVSGQNITVDAWAKRPEVIARRIAEVAQKKFVAGSLFSISSIATGTVITEIPNAVDNDLFTSGDVQTVEPLTKYPGTDIVRGTLTAFTPRKIGFDYEVSEEAIEDNDIDIIPRATTAMTNTVLRKLDQYAVAAMVTATSTYSRTQAAATTWTALNAVTHDSKTNASTALDVFALAEKKLAEEERNFDETFDSLLLNPAQVYALTLALGKGWKATLNDTFGISNVLSSNRVTAGTGYYYAAGQVGAMRFNRPLRVKRRLEEDIDGVVLNVSARFSEYVNEPYAFLQLTGL